MDTSEVVDPGIAGSCEDYWAQVQALRADLALLRQAPQREGDDAG